MRDGAKSRAFEEQRVDSLTDLQTIAEAGGSLYEHERAAMEMIRARLSKEGRRILSNILLHDTQSGGYYECDVIVVATSGLYVVELKHWSGTINIAPYQWTINGFQSRSDPHKTNVLKCKILKGIYQHKFRTYPDTWVESLVVLTNPAAVVENADSPVIAAERHKRGVTLASISDLVTYVRKKDSLAASKSPHLSVKQIDAIADYLESLSIPRRSVRFRVPGYETVEYLSQRADCVELIARPMTSEAKGLYRFRVFRVPTGLPAIERQRFMMRAYNTLKAVKEIGDHPNIQKVFVLENEDGDIIECSEWNETETLATIVRSPEKKLPVSDCLKICAGIASALNCAHDAGLIHRAVKPENIALVNGQPKLMNFDLAFRLEEKHLTVIPDPSELKDDGYTAPELLTGSDIDEATDFFSLGVIAFELLTGRRPFKSARQHLADAGRIDQSVTDNLFQTGVEKAVAEAILQMIVPDRTKRLKDGIKIFKLFGGERKAAFELGVLSEPNPKLESGAHYDIFEIEELVGHGTEAQVYRAKTVREERVALKLFNREIPRERILSEAEITSIIDSPYVVRCDNRIGHWKDERYFIVLEYVDGRSMREIIDKGLRPEVQTFMTVALGLMEGLAAFHEHRDANGGPNPLVHSDLKPENILISNRDSKPVIIDCGIAGQPRVDTFQGTPGYVPPDCIRGTDMQFSEDGDRFALAVTLWEWLFGEKPYENPAVGDVAVWPMEGAPEGFPLGIREWFLQGVATEAQRRFDSIEGMRKAFLRLFRESEAGAESTVGVESIRAIPVMPVKFDLLMVDSERSVTQPILRPKAGTEEFVSYLNTLSNASPANENALAEFQVINRYFGWIRVESPIAQTVYDQLILHKRNVILTGNAGDGKTTIAAEVFRRLTGELTAMKPVEIIRGPGIAITIVKDMSELAEQERRRIFRSAVEDTSQTYLIVSNTGTLISTVPKSAESELLGALEAVSPQEILEGKFLVINIGRLDSIDTAVKVLTRMVDDAHWMDCHDCAVHDECPIWNNVEMIQMSRDTVCSRISMVYRRLFEYGIRLTMRQMTGHLAYALTGGMTCNAIREMSHIGHQQLRSSYSFVNRFFGDDGRDMSADAWQLLPIREIQKSEFGVLLDPLTEWSLWGARDYARLLPPHILAQLGSVLKSGCPESPEDRRQLRRWLFFFGNIEERRDKKFLTLYLNSPSLLDYLKYAVNRNPIPPAYAKRFVRNILQVVQESFCGVKLPQDAWDGQYLYITICPPGKNPSTQLVVAQLSGADFRLAHKTYFSAGDFSVSRLALRFIQGDAQVDLDLDLPFLDYVARRYEGDVTQDLTAYYMDRLQRFKAELLEAQGRSYVRAVDGHVDEDCEAVLNLLQIAPNRKFRVLRCCGPDGDQQRLREQTGPAGHLREQRL